MAGEDDDSDDEDAYFKKPVIQRIIITAAGALVNIIVGMLVLSILVIGSDTLPSTTVGEFRIPVEGTVSSEEQGLMLNDRITHVDTCSAQTGPIFLAYRSEKVINDIVKATQEKTALYDFTAVDGIVHRVWKIDDSTDVANIQKAFENIDQIYIADGHHRAASAVKVGLKRREENPSHAGNEEYNFFLSVLFPHDQLMIMDYNRTVKDLNGLTKEAFLAKVEENFSVALSDSPVKPEIKGTVGMYLDKQWYTLTAKEELFAGKDAVGSLDVSVLQDYLLGPVLGIGDPRTDSRIDFVGGIRGLSELEKRADNDMKVSFSMYPTSITELFDVADQNLLMPPKSTWFEPKLRSGLFIHEI